MINDPTLRSHRWWNQFYYTKIFDVKGRLESADGEVFTFSKKNERQKKHQHRSML